MTTTVTVEVHDTPPEKLRRRLMAYNYIRKEWTLQTVYHIRRYWGSVFTLWHLPVDAEQVVKGGE